MHQLKDFVVQTKLTPFHPVRRTLHRPRLARRLEEAFDYPLTILHAGTGYGKSTALADLVKSNHPIVWYHLEEDDADPIVFLLYLLHGFDNAAPGSAEPALAALEAWDRAETALPWESITDLLINGIAGTNTDGRPIILILDDAHHLNRSPRSLDILERLIRYAPRCLHVVLSTRYPLKFKDLVISRVRGEVLEIAEEELAFTREEIASLFSTHYDIDLSEEEIDLLARETGGWAIALQLIWQGMRESQEPGIAQVLENMTGVRDDLFTYLAREVLEQQPADIQEFLRQTSVLRQLTPALCDCLQDRTDSANLLDQLADNGLFVVELGPGTIRYHPLFREFLYHSLPDDKRTAVHLRAAQCYEDREEHEEAVHHLLKAGAFEQATGLIQVVGRGMVQAGLLSTLAGWIDALPLDTLEQHPTLLVYLGDIGRLHSRFDEALGWYKQAEERFRIRGDAQGISQALRGQARIYLDTVNPSQAESLLREALRLSDGQQDRAARASLLELLAENQLNRGRSEEARKLREEAQALREEGPGADELDVRVLLRTGRLDEAREELSRRAEAERAEPVMRPRAHRETLLLLSFILACQGQSNAAYANAIEGTERGQALNSPFITAVGYMRQGHSWLLREGETHYEEARQCFEQAIEIGDTLAVSRLKVEAYWGLCRVYGFQGQIKQAEEAAQKGIAIAQEAGDEWITALIYTAMGAATVLCGQHDEAADWLLQALNSIRECSDTFVEAAVRLWQCLLLLATGDEARLAHALDDLLGLVQEYDYTYLFTRPTLPGPPDPRRAVPLLLHARAEGIHAELADGLLKQLGLQDLQHHPGYRLRVETLGAFRVWRGQEEVEAGDWQREKARQLFLLLLSSRGIMLDKNKIADSLWPDLAADAADQNFRVALNALYRVLEPDRARGAPSSYIARDGTLYGLRPGADLWLDAAHFEEEVRKGDVLLDTDPAASLTHYRAAIRLYHGNYLEEFIYEEEWWREQRERYRVLYLRTADRLAQLLIDRKEWEESIEVCQAILVRDDWWERAYRLMMRAYAELGNRPQAIRVYQRLEQRLRDDLDTVPSAETTELYQQILSPGE